MTTVEWLVVLISPLVLGVVLGWLLVRANRRGPEDRFESIEARVTALEARVDTADARIAALEVPWRL